MGKIFLVEPYRVLQQAISLSLFPEFDVRVEASIDASGVASLEEVDLLILDAAALRESSRLPPELTRAVQGSAIPTLWIDEAAAADAPKREKLVVVVKPIESGALQSALTGLLSGSKPRPNVEQKAKINKDEQKAEAEPIELVEIVEEESPSETRSSVEKRK
jgi:hypothetical protein